MSNSSVDELINLVQRLRQEKAACEETISQTKHKARVLERRVEDVARQVGMATMAKEEKEAMMAAMKGRVESKKKMFDQVKQKENLTQATVKDCMEKAEGETKERFSAVGEYEDEMMQLSDKMSKHSLVCTVTRLKNTLRKVVEEERMTDRRLEDKKEVGQNIEISYSVDRVIGWKKMRENCVKLGNNVAVMGEMARGQVEQLKEDLSLLVERRNTILMSNS